MRQFYGEVISSGQAGHIALVTNGTDVYEIQPLADPRNRAFYHRPAAEGLAANHAAFLNGGGQPTSSFVRR